jgi:hypothetical protein
MFSSHPGVKPFRLVFSKAAHKLSGNMNIPLRNPGQNCLPDSWDNIIVQQLAACFVCQGGVQGQTIIRTRVPDTYPGPRAYPGPGYALVHPGPRYTRDQNLPGVPGCTLDTRVPGRWSGASGQFPPPRNKVGDNRVRLLTGQTLVEINRKIRSLFFG